MHHVFSPPLEGMHFDRLGPLRLSMDDGMNEEYDPHHKQFDQHLKT